MTFHGGSFLPGLASLVLGTHARAGSFVDLPRLWAAFPAGKNWVLCLLLCFQHPHRLRAPADLCCAVPRQALATRRQSPEGQGCSRSGPSETVSDCSQQEGPEQSGAAVCRQCSKVTSGKSSAAPRLRAHVCACVLVHMPVGVQVRTRVLVRVPVREHMCWGICLWVCERVHVYVGTHVPVYASVCMRVCWHPIPVCVCTHVCAWAGPHTLHSSLLLRGLTGEEASAGRAGSSLLRHSRRMSNSRLFLQRTIVRKGNTRVGGSPVCLLRKILHSHRFWACLQGL